MLDAGGAPRCLRRAELSADGGGVQRNLLVVVDLDSRNIPAESGPQISIENELGPFLGLARWGDSFSAIAPH
jgi:hypothetical protein